MKTPNLNSTKSDIESGATPSKTPNYTMDVLDRFMHSAEALVDRASFEHAPFTKEELMKEIASSKSVHDVYALEANEAVRLAGEAKKALDGWNVCVAQSRSLVIAAERYLTAVGADPTPVKIALGGMSQVSIARNIMRLPGAFEIAMVQVASSPYWKGLHAQAGHFAGQVNDRLAAWKKAQAAVAEHEKLTTKIQGAYELAVFRIRDMLRAIFTNDAAALDELKLPARGGTSKKAGTDTKPATPDTPSVAVVRAP
jgi:hypothetical protein